jgi:sulfur-carrier protein
MRVLLFARARELAGADTLEVALTAGATVRDLRQQLGLQCPRLAGLVDRCAIAVNNEYAGDAAALPVDVEIALLPPVSGG